MKDMNCFVILNSIPACCDLWYRCHHLLFDFMFNADVFLFIMLCFKSSDSAGERNMGSVRVTDIQHEQMCFIIFVRV